MPEDVFTVSFTAAELLTTINALEYLERVADRGREEFLNLDELENAARAADDAALCRSLWVRLASIPLPETARGAD